MRFFENILIVTQELAPWLFFGLLLSSVIHTFVPNAFFQKHLGGKGYSAIFKSVLFGVPMPLCSCAVIPVALSLKKQGAGKASSVSFLISTPQTGLDSIFVSASMLGWPFALLKLISAFVLGVLGGVLSHIFDKDSTAQEGAECETNENESGAALTVRSFVKYAVDDLLFVIWKWLLLGIVASAAISTWLPPDLFLTFQQKSLLLIFLMVLFLSVPLYICATSSVPVAAALVDAGMPASAALIFLIAGPATNIATIGAVYKSLGFRSLMIYLVTVILGTIFFAYCFDGVLGVSSTFHEHVHSNTFSLLCAVLLLSIFIYFLIKDFRSFQKASGSRVAGLSLYIEELRCQRCVSKINVIFEENDIRKFSVSLKDKKLYIADSERSYVEIVEILKKAGFSKIEKLS